MIRSRGPKTAEPELRSYERIVSDIFGNCKPYFRIFFRGRVFLSGGVPPVTRSAAPGQSCVYTGHLD